MRSDAAKLPAAHGVGATEPLLQKVPAGQTVHCEESPKSYDLDQEPAGQGRPAEAPLGQKAPASHGVQKVALYLA